MGRKPLLVGYLWCCVLLACSASPPMRYYTLKAIAPSVPAGSAADMSAANSAVIRVEPVVIPPELDRLELVSHSGPYGVHVADSDRWAAPLEDQIRRVESDDLTLRLPPHLMADPNEPATSEPRRLLSIAIAEFYADDHCATILRVNWTLRSPKGVSERGAEEVHMPANEPCVGALPAAMSGALAVLADRLAAKIAVQPAAASDGP
jgi:uncharacterized lipoprotein YmbA